MRFKSWIGALLLGGQLLTFACPAWALSESQLQARTFGRAIRAGDLTAIETFVARHKTDLNQSIFVKEAVYLRPLTLALLHSAPRHRLDTLDILLRLGAPLNYQEPDLKLSSPLHLVLRYLPQGEALPMVQYLLARRADGNLVMRDSEDLTPAELAAKKQSTAAEFLKKFEPTGLSNMNLVYSATAYHQGNKNLKTYRLTESCVAAIQEQDTDLLEASLQAGANPNARLQNEMDAPLLFLALESQNQALVARLLAAGARIDLQDKDGNLALHHAVKVGHPAMLKLILQTKADLNQRNKAGLAPLHLAIQRQSPESVSLLLKAGASSQLRTGQGQSPQALADSLAGENMARIQALLASPPRQ